MKNLLRPHALKGLSLAAVAGLALSACSSAPSQEEYHAAVSTIVDQQVGDMLASAGDDELTAKVEGISQCISDTTYPEVSDGFKSAVIDAAEAGTTEIKASEEDQQTFTDAVDDCIAEASGESPAEEDSSAAPAEEAQSTDAPDASAAEETDAAAAEETDAAAPAADKAPAAEFETAIMNYFYGSILENASAAEKDAFAPMGTCLVEESYDTMSAEGVNALIADGQQAQLSTEDLDVLATAGETCSELIVG